MVANSAMDSKSFSRVATFAKATAAEEHVERVDLWKKVERFMAGWSATEMPRSGVRPCGLAPWAEKTTVVIMSDFLSSWGLVHGIPINLMTVWLNTYVWRHRTV